MNGSASVASIDSAAVDARVELVDAAQDDGELVTGEAGHEPPAERVDEAHRDVLQQAIALLVAERVVHVLEAVEVDEQHGDDAVAAGIRAPGARRRTAAGSAAG